MAKTYKTPNLKAPRFRPKRLNLTNKDVHKEFLQEYKKYNNLSVDQFKEIISAFNAKIWNKAIDYRDGVELPEQMGYIFIGSCPRQKSNIDFKKSAELGVKIQHQNYESDSYTAKIFYTNFETKYKFKHHDLWGFQGLRNFRRKVGEIYPVEWKKYVVVDNMVKASRLFRSLKFKHTKMEEASLLLEEYDEFNLD